MIKQPTPLDILQFSCHVEHSLDKDTIFYCYCGQTLFVFRKIVNLDDEYIDRPGPFLHTNIYVTTCYNCSVMHRFQYKLKNKRPFEIVKCLMI